MARIFTISFTYNSETFNTMVTVKTTPFYMEYTLTNLDPELLLQLPGNKIISPATKKFFFPNASSHNSAELMNSIIKAVTGHLQALTGRLSPGG
jgi:hypothetical protein